MPQILTGQQCLDYKKKSSVEAMIPSNSYLLMIAICQRMMAVHPPPGAI